MYEDKKLPFSCFLIVPKCMNSKLGWHLPQVPEITQQTGSSFSFSRRIFNKIDKDLIKDFIAYSFSCTTLINHFNWPRASGQLFVFSSGWKNTEGISESRQSWLQCNWPTQPVIMPLSSDNNSASPLFDCLRASKWDVISPLPRPFIFKVRECRRAGVSPEGQSCMNRKLPEEITFPLLLILDLAITFCPLFISDML